MTQICACIPTLRLLLRPSLGRERPSYISDNPRVSRVPSFMDPDMYGLRPYPCSGYTSTMPTRPGRTASRMLIPSSIFSFGDESLLSVLSSNEEKQQIPEFYSLKTSSESWTVGTSSSEERFVSGYGGDSGITMAEASRHSLGEYCGYPG